MNKASLATYFIACSIALIACNGADFGGTNSSKSPASSTDCSDDDPDCDPSNPGSQNPGGPAGPGSPGSDDCVDGEKLNVEWAGEVKECLIDQGKTYNFELKRCAEMRQSKFSCTWDNVTKELEDRGLLTDVLSADSKSGAKLVSCGQSEDGNRIVVQWVSIPEGGTVDCKKASTGASITTGCYTLYKSGETRPDTPSNEDERAQQVYDCMNRL